MNIEYSQSKVCSQIIMTLEYCYNQSLFLIQAKELRAEFDRREKPLVTAKELIGDEPELVSLSQKCERIKNLTDFYLSKVRL